jgi:tRNA (guanine37-N1)-methyltransferase
LRDRRCGLSGRTLIEVSIGDYILSGGEIAALAILDAYVRLLPGVMGRPDSGVEESFEPGALEYPRYTHPREWEGRSIPDVLLSGDHAQVEQWRRQEAELITRERRPDFVNKPPLARLARRLPLDSSLRGGMISAFSNHEAGQ